MKRTEKHLSRNLRLLCAVFIFIISFAVYFNAIFNGFVYDDLEQVLENPWLKDVSSIPAVFTSNVWGFLPDNAGSNFYRPMMHLIYMMTYQAFGFQAWAFHLVNVIFHAGVSVLVFIILLKLLSRYYGRDPEAFILPSLAASLLFAVHPVHAEAVAWVAGLPDLSYSFFTLLSFYLYIRSEGGFNKSYFFSLLSFFIAALCKEPALTLPAFIIVYDHLSEKPGGRLQYSLKRYSFFLVAAVVYLLLRLNALGGFAPAESQVKLSAYGRFLNMPLLFSEYLKLLILPVNLNVYHIFNPVTSFFDARNLISLLIIAAFIAAAAVSFRKNRALFLSLLIILLPLLPVYIHNAFAERFLYLPSAGPAIQAAILLAHLMQRRGAAFKLTLALSVIIVLISSLATVKRNIAWENNYTLFSDAARKSPGAAAPHFFLGPALMEMGRTDEAIEEFLTALKFEPDSVEVLNNLGNAYDKKGLIDKAIEQYEIALKLDPGAAAAHYNLGIAYGKKGLLDKAVEHFNAALEIAPDNADAHYNLGYAYELKGMAHEAEEHYAIAQRLREGE